MQWPKGLTFHRSTDCLGLRESYIKVQSTGVDIKIVQDAEQDSVSDRNVGQESSVVSSANGLRMEINKDFSFW